MNPPAHATLDGPFVFFDCDDFEIDAKPAPYIIVTIDEARGNHSGGPSSTGRDDINSARRVLGRRIGNQRSSHGWVYEQVSDSRWELVEPSARTMRRR